MVERWEISDQPMAIGRDETSEITVNDGTLSRRHFQIWREGERYLLKDLGSRNGTWVDGKPAQGTMLRQNDCILAGRSLFLFSEDPLSAGFSPKGQPPTHDTAFLPAALAAERAANKVGARAKRS
jgi:pSer/pThr/pTyr-binding forkhead associated (FHA) protein